MESASQALFAVGSILLALGFAAHVGHAVLLANGRRALSLAIARQEPAYAGAVSGSFVTARAAATEASAASVSGASSPLSGAALWATVAATLVIGASLLLRAIVVQRGPWGNLFEFSVAFGFSIVVGYLVLGRRFPIRSIGFIPVGV